MVAEDKVPYDVMVWWLRIWSYDKEANGLRVKRRRRPKDSSLRQESHWTSSPHPFTDSRAMVTSHILYAHPPSPATTHLVK